MLRRFMKFKCFLFLVTLVFFNCKKETKKQLQIESKHQEIALKYAKGFSIKTYDTYKVLEIKTPWPNAEKAYRYLLINKTHANKTGFVTGEYDGIIAQPIQKIVVTSTTHIPALELLGVAETLVGFPGTDYISSEKIRTNINNGSIRELGKNEGLNTEILLELSSLKALKNANENHALFDAFQNKSIYTFNNTTGSSGGVSLQITKSLNSYYCGFWFGHFRIINANTIQKSVGWPICFRCKFWC